MKKLISRTSMLCKGKSRKKSQTNRINRKNDLGLKVEQISVPSFFPFEDMINVEGYREFNFQFDDLSSTDLSSLVHETEGKKADSQVT